jgi:hypothetical protein
MDLDDEELKATRILNGADKNSRTRFKNEIKVSEIYRQQGRELEEEDRKN